MLQRGLPSTGRYFGPRLGGVQVANFRAALETQKFLAEDALNDLALLVRELVEDAQGFRSHPNAGGILCSHPLAVCVVDKQLAIEKHKGDIAWDSRSLIDGTPRDTLGLHWIARE